MREWRFLIPARQDRQCSHGEVGGEDVGMQHSERDSGATGRTHESHRCLVFLHIPKTGGQSLHFVLQRHFTHEETILLHTLDKPLHEQLGRIALADRSRARLVWGHMPYGVHQHIPGPCDYMTVVRDPVSRVVSVYKHILKSSSHVLHDRVADQRIGLEQYVQSGIDEGQTENSQTRQLSGRQFGVSDRQALDQAKRNLQGFLVVGLTERFEETLVLVRRTLGLGLPVYVTRNVSPPFDVSERAVELIRERNTLDVDLYAFVKTLFSEQIYRQGRSFRIEASMFEALRPVARAAGRAADVVRRVQRRSTAN
jgi:Sulfotransferase family